MTDLRPSFSYSESFIQNLISLHSILKKGSSYHANFTDRDLIDSLRMCYRRGVSVQISLRIILIVFAIAIDGVMDKVTISVCVKKKC